MFFSKICALFLFVFTDILHRDDGKLGACAFPKSNTFYPATLFDCSESLALDLFNYLISINKFDCRF